MSDVSVRGKVRSVGLLAAVLVASLVVLAVGDGRAQAQPELPGIDVSNWQHQIDWLAVAGTGNAFVFAKATEGTTFTDLTFPFNRSGATGLGMRFGAYHFARPTGSSDAAAVASAIAQADHFLSVAEPLPGGLLPVLDVENAGGLSVARLSLWVQTWLGEVVAQTGVKPMVYVSPSFWKTKLGDSPVVAVSGHRLWIAHWTKDALPILPGAGWGGLGWSFWQWSSCQKVAGIVGCVDADRFNGSSLASVTVPAYGAGPPTRIDVPTIVGGPQAGKLLAATPGAWGGGKPVSFGYQWQRCDASGRSCAPIAAATAEGYTPNAADVGHSLLVLVSAATPAGTATASSVPTLAVASSGAAAGTAPKPRSLPSIEGSMQVGQTLTALAGTWTGSPTSFSYQWRRCAADGTACTAIDGAGGGTYTITPGDVDATLSLTVTAVAKGGAASATSAPTAVVTAAPVPPPAVGTALAQAGQAGAVTTITNVAVATWQPGALPDQAAVGLADTASRLPLPGTAIRLSFGAPAPLPWPIDVQYAAAPADTVPGILPLRGVWQPLAELPSPTLPAAQQAGAYRDPAGTLHVLTRTAGRIALFAAGKWGDPRYATTHKPRVAPVTAATVKPAADRSATFYARITLDTQAHLYVSLIAANGKKLVLPQKGARVGWWLAGKPAKTLQALQLRPGALPIRLHVPAAQLRAKGPYTLRIVAVDPYGRKSNLTLKVT
jgi:GH25 family lysozyme M1 (1,4-beta-N-acetylmuramidase)